MYVCVDCVLLKVVTTHVNVEKHVVFVVVFVFNSSEDGTKTWQIKKPRKPSGSKGEMGILADACMSFNNIIRGKLSPSLTLDMKKKAWEAITDK